MCFGGGDDPSPEERKSRMALMEQATTMLQQYGDLFVPLENQYIENVQNTFDSSNYDRAMGAGSLEAARAYEPGLRDMRQGAFNRGFDPTSGAFMAESDALRGAQARGMGMAAADRGISNTDSGYAGLQNIVRMGQGLQTDAFQGQMDVAASAADRIRGQAESDFKRSSTLQGLAGTVTGAAAGIGLNA